jgi:hypothetical protein
MIVWRSVLGLLLLGAVAAAEQEDAAAKPLRDGALLRNVDGTIGRADSNDLWHFELERDVNEPELQVPAGTRFTLLPSAALENLIVDANDRQAPRYRLTAQVTQYRGANFLFPTYYLPLSKLRDANEPPAQAPSPEPADVNTPTRSRPGDDTMAIPPEIAQRLKTRRTALAPQRPVPEASAADEKPRRPLSHVLVDAVGFVELQQGRAEAPIATDRVWELHAFVPNAFGWNVSAFCYQLLPNQVLEQTEQQVAAWPEPTRLMIAGLVTEYRGRKYLLLHRVIRVYSHGNFGG